MGLTSAENDVEREGCSTGVATGVGSTIFGRWVATGSGCAAGAGGGALLVRVGVGTAAGGGAEGAGPSTIAPVSKLMYLGDAVFPEKNSDAVSAGSSDGAGG